MDIISIPLGWVMKFIYDFVGNYGFSLILFTLFTKIILLPLTIRQKKSMIRQNVFQPLINDINKKYAGDAQKRAEEMQKLQQEYGFSITAGCLPLLIQMPILFGLVDVIYKPLKHIIGLSDVAVDELAEIARNLGLMSSQAFSGEEAVLIGLIQNNSAPFASVLDGTSLTAIQNLNLVFFGIDLTAIPTLAFNVLLIIPILSVVTMLGSTLLNMKLSGQKLEGPAKNTLFITPIMFLYFSFNMPVGVSLYWIFSSFFTMVIDLIIRLFINFNKEKAKIEEEIRLKKEELKLQKKEAPKRVAAQRAAQKAKAIELEDDGMSDTQRALAEERLQRARELDREKYGE